MALFTDSDIISANSLSAIDSEAQSVAASTKPAILVEGAGSICELAWQECGRRVLQAMQSFVSYPAQTGMPATHIAAVTNVGVPARTQPRIRLNQIVATDVFYASMASQIQRWIEYCALTMLFRDASSRLGKDRLEEKMERYAKDAANAWRGLRNEGLPMVYHPLEAPGAKHAFGAGTWSASNITSVSGGSNANIQNVYVAITYYDSSKYNSQTDKGNAESAPSAIQAFPIPANQLLHVDITSLTPPTGASDPLGQSQGIYSPLNATHWNIWAGLSMDAMYLQKAGVPIATKSWSLTADPVASGSLMGPGQFADLNLVFMSVINRG